VQALPSLREVHARMAKLVPKEPGKYVIFDGQDGGFVMPFTERDSNPVTLRFR
jgi:hypothetical protein